MKILLIGNSFSYYWTDELYRLLAADGKDDAVVANIYYSGCSFNQHVDWWKNNVDNYNFIIHDKNGRTSIKPTVFEDCISYAEWDVISFQQSGKYIYGASLERHDQMIGDYLPELYQKVHDRFPNATYYWLQNWTHELGNGAGKGMKTREGQIRIYEGFRDIGLKYCKEYGFINVPCGDAWELIRHDPMFYQEGNEGEFPALTLHSRIWKAGSKLNYKFVHNKDLSHDGDIGGGQYLNACVWFEMLTHKSVIGNSYVPVYVHEISGIEFKFREDRVAALQKAAHQAVFNIHGTGWYK